MNVVALTHTPSPEMNACIRTHAAHEEIDLVRAEAQHSAYREALEKAGARVHVLDVNIAHPDAVFIEDCAIVLDEIAIITSMTAAARRPEPPGIEAALAHHRRSLARIAWPATLEGGDVVRVGKKLLVGLTARTSGAGIAALLSIVEPFGYEVMAVPVEGCLHLKTACTVLPDGALLMNPAWLPRADELRSFECVPVPIDEPYAANVVVVGEHIIMASSYPRTADRMARHARNLHPVDLSEFAKADGGATCLSLVFALSA